MIRARFSALPVVALLLLVGGAAHAQAKRPDRKGHKLSIKVDSQPQQAAIYIDDKAYGIEGYTPATLKLPKGSYKFILEAQGYKPLEKVLLIERTQSYVFTLERQARPAVLDVRAAADQSASGGTITVDGAQVGVVPNRIEVGAGSHLIEIKRPGYLDYRDNLQVAEGETRTVVVVLPQAVKPGSLLVTSDVPGADVFVDGQRKDAAPAVIDGLPEGAHTIEVRKDPMTPWKQVVTVIAGQQLKVAAQLTPAAPPAGSLKVLSGTTGAEVFVDGDDKGPAGVEIKDVRAGSHIVEVRAKGMGSKRQELEIKPGELRVVEVDLAPGVAERQIGAVRVISPVPNAEVFLDGSSVGKVPVDKSDVTAGHHFIVVHRDGYAEYRTEVEVPPGKSIEVTADLRAAGTIRALANVTGAEVYVDGTRAGVTPTTISDVAVGDHLIETKSAGYLDDRRTVTVTGGQQQIVTVDLRPVLTGPTPADLVRQQREQSSFGATVIERYKFNVDVGFGDPYFAMFRVVSGAARFGNFGADVAVELRTNIYETDVGIRPRVQLFRADPLAVGFDVTVLGGGGPSKRNSFTFEAGPIATLLAGSYVRVSFHPYVGVWSDRLCPSVTDIQNDDKDNGKMSMGQIVPGSGPLYQEGEQGICKAYDVMRSKTPGTYGLDPQSSRSVIEKSGFVPTTAFGQTDPRERFVTTRFMLQAVLEIMATQNFNLWVLVEGAPFQDQRQAFTSKFNAAFTDQDFPLYVRFGASLKF